MSAERPEDEPHVRLALLGVRASGVSNLVGAWLCWSLMSSHGWSWLGGLGGVSLLLLIPGAFGIERKRRQIRETLAWARYGAPCAILGALPLGVLAVADHVRKSDGWLGAVPGLMLLGVAGLNGLVYAAFRGTFRAWEAQLTPEDHAADLEVLTVAEGPRTPAQLAGAIAGWGLLLAFFGAFLPFALGARSRAALAGGAVIGALLGIFIAVRSYEPREADRRSRR